MKGKIVVSTMSLILIGMIIYPKPTVSATDFAGKEDEYTEMCQDTSSLSKSDIQVCSEFNNYLKNKNSHIEDDISETQSKLQNTISDLNTAQDMLSQTNAQIASVQDQLLVLKGNIEQLNQDISDKKEQLRDRMYILQSYVNGNELLNIIFSSGSLDELLTRIQCVDELTTYDKDLITGLAQDKTQLEEKSLEMSTQYDNLFALQSQQTSLLTTLGEKANQYQSSLDSNNVLLNQYREDVGYIDSSLSDAEKRLQAEQDRQEAEEEANKEQESQKPNPEQKPDTSIPETPDHPNEPSIDNTDIQTALVNTALSKNGAPYVYGGTGPNSFDCSGFAQWVYSQNGIYIPRTVTSQYYACDLVNSPQPGDLVFFNTYTFLGHVGIYIGNGQFIHAGTSDTGVYIANFYSSYWQSVYQGAGRFS